MRCKLPLTSVAVSHLKGLPKLPKYWSSALGLVWSLDLYLLCGKPQPSMGFYKTVFARIIFLRKFRNLACLTLGNYAKELYNTNTTYNTDDLVRYLGYGRYADADWLGLLPTGLTAGQPLIRNLSRKCLRKNTLEFDRLPFLEVANWQWQINNRQR